MANSSKSVVLPCILLISAVCLAASQISDRKLHIVYLGETTSNNEGDHYATVAASHHDLIESSLGSHEAAEQHLAYSYVKSFNGFAAWLTHAEANRISKKEDVISVFENREKKHMTTRSWDFMGFPQTVQRNLPYEGDVIVGILDTGIWPESKSFSDMGFGPIPSKWNGKCQITNDFHGCNKKLIGAKFYNIGNKFDPTRDFLSPRDGNGHGSHTSSTVAGNVVQNASLFGVAQGDARGGVPGARIAMYKVCTSSGSCGDADILAGFDDAIYDGVDIVSVSLGSELADYKTLDYFEDSVAIGAFHAMKKGILVSNSAGNSGPSRESVINFSPWSLTVAASTIDRQYITPLLLGNNVSLKGYSINTFSMEKAWYPLIYAGDAPNISAGYSSRDSQYCQSNSLDRNKVHGKIVLCDETYYEGVIVAGGAGVITTSDTADIDPFFSIPGTSISTAIAYKVKSFINSSSYPTALILRTTNPNGAAAPIVASFSSRGPNPITPGILKPDITAPGVHILAAWSKARPLESDSGRKRFPDYNIISGTSMSCPHVAGAAAYVKSFHPHWSPAALRSALMTTARPLDLKLKGNEDAEFGYGAGHIDPVKAKDPGLVYDADLDSYTSFLCSQGYNSTALYRLTGDNITCPYNVPRNKGEGASELNYPSMMVVTKAGETFSATFPRTVTNVGPAQYTYKAVVNTSSGVKVIVEPETLSFSSTNQKLSYTLKVEGKAPRAGTMIACSLTWNYANYNVRSPIVVYGAHPQV